MHLIILEVIKIFNLHIIKAEKWLMKMLSEMK